MTALRNLSAFGLTIESEIDLPELPFAPAKNERDVQIKVAPIGSGISDPAGRGTLWKTAPGLFEMHVPGTARFLVRDGREILVEPEAEANPAEIRTYLLGSACGALLQQRGYLVLHAGGFVHRDHAVLICGGSGAGKSTVIQGMMQRGFHPMSDDLVPVHFDHDGQAIAHSGYPHTRLCPDAATHFQYDEHSPAFLANAGRKLVVGMTNFDQTPRPIAAIFCLETHNRSGLELERETSLPATSKLIHFSYRRNFLVGMSLRAHQFELATKVAHQVPVFSIRRDTTLKVLDALLDRVDLEIRSLPHCE